MSSTTARQIVLAARPQGKPLLTDFRLEETQIPTPGAGQVVGAPRTNRDLPRMMPQRDLAVAALIHQHYEWIRDGLAIRQGWRRWVQGGGPCDKRSSKGRMSYSAYRRMLSNPQKHEAGGSLNWTNSVKDVQPDTEVVFQHCEELRIVEDKLFFAVQRRLEQLKKGPRGPKRRRELNLWDVVTEVFFCASGKGGSCQWPTKAYAGTGNRRPR